MFNKKRLMARMFLRGITVKELAAQLDISCSALYKKINNKSHFYCFEIKKLSDILDIQNPIEYFYSEAETL